MIQHLNGHPFLKIACLMSEQDSQHSQHQGRNPFLVVGGIALLGTALALLLFGSDLFGRQTTTDLAESGISFSGGSDAQPSQPIVSDALELHPEGPQVGDVAPDFTLNTLDGDSVELSDYRGKPVIVNFWATWCAPCRIEMPDLQAAYEGQQEETGLIILAVNEEEAAASVRAYFYDEMNLTFTPLLDEIGAVGNLYGVFNMPATFFVAPDGLITALHRGPLTEGLIEEYLSLTLSQS